jgi:nucleoside-diphosphate-sugar epimerase
VRVFVAGATGAIGRQLVPLLVSSGHRVTGLTRTESKAAAIRDAGAEAVVADVFDAHELAAAVLAQSPDVVVHELTAIPARIDPRRFAEEFAPTNRVRREGTRNLLAAATAAGSRRIIVQSIAQAYAPLGGWVKAEDDPLYSDAPAPFADTFQAVIDLEAIALGSEGIEPVVLRYGNLYGPGTRFAADGSDAELVREGRFPIAGGGPAHWSFIHVQDAARATVQALDRGTPGIYNVVDDEPAPVADWLPAYAAALDAPPPGHVDPPRSDYAIHGMLLARGASNSKAKQQLGWKPLRASWREGFRADLA